MSFCYNDLTSASVEGAILPNTQGNILRGYGRLKTTMAFFRFERRASVSAARTWIAKHIADKASPLAPTDAAKHNEIAKLSAPLVNFFLTAAGAEYLGHSRDKFEAAFGRGSRDERTIRQLNDVPSERWQEEHCRPCDGVVSWAANTDAEVTQLKKYFEQSFAEIGTHTYEDGFYIDHRGKPLSDLSEPHYEHFGYKDGMSGPVFLSEHWARLEGTFAHGEAGADPRRPLSTVLTPDPLVADGAGFASYFVFRKLEQDVLGFKARVAKYVGELKRRGKFLNEVWAAKGDKLGYDLFSGNMPSDEQIQRFIERRVMGRDRDGSPWTQWNQAGGNPDEFTYAGDAGGRVCPFYAHVRKMNPRGATGDVQAELRRTLVRRSVPYGTVDEAGGRYQQSVGLLFLCAQSSISEQFEFVQSRWANATSVELDKYPTPTVDGLIGQRSPQRQSYEEDRHRKISETIDLDLDFYDLVKLRAAEYLLAPSLPGIAALAAGGSR